MAKGDNDSDNNNSHSEKSIDPNNSFVKKVKSRVSGFIPTTFSKWFSGNERTTANVRLRDEEEDDDPFRVQPPPSKRARIPLNVEYPPNSFIVDPPLPNCKQKSALPISEPVAGPSGIRSQKAFSTTLSDLQSTYPVIPSEHMNGDNKSDSGESTSGYSSMPILSRKQQNPIIPSTSMQNASFSNIGSRALFNASIGAQNRSLFSERSLSPQVNSSLSSRRPSFNASTFGSPGFVDRTLTTKRIVNSPFYIGRTMYGGASAYGKRLKMSPNSSASAAKNSFQVKPVNEPSTSATSENVVLSKTARRILDTLEQFSSPILDAKRIPNVSRRQPMKPDSTASKPYSRDQSRSATANVELQVPTIPELLRMKQKEKLQDSTVAVRHIATTSKSTLNSEEYQIRRQDDDGASAKHSSKMKTKLTLGQNRKGKASQEDTSTFKLPEVALPISTLPKFDFTLPPPPSAFASTSKSAAAVAKQPAKPQAETSIFAAPKTSKTPEKMTFNAAAAAPTVAAAAAACTFKFASPLIVTGTTTTPTETPVQCSNSYKFSEPILVTDAATVPVVCPPAKSAAERMMPLTFNFKSSDAATSSPALKKTVKNNGQSTTSVVDVVKPAAQLLTTGSVMDVLGKKKMPPPQQQQQQAKADDDLMNKFKPAAGTWECSSCMIRNLPHADACAACQTKREQNSSAPKAAAAAAFGGAAAAFGGAAPPKSAGSAPKSDGFGSAFRVTSDKWECSACMVRNSNADDRCIACTTPKPAKKNSLPVANTFGDKFKAASGTWECATCMIRNQSDLHKCAACETPKPGAQTAAAAPAKKLPTAFNTDGLSAPMKQQSAGWECASCLVRNDESKTACACCETPKPGCSAPKQTATPKSSLPLNFNAKEWECSSCLIRNEPAKSRCACCDAPKPGSVGMKECKFGIPVNSPPKFSFGLSKAQNAVPAFSFGIPPGTTQTQVPKPSEIFGSNSPPPTTTATFSFGIKSNVSSAPATKIETTKTVSSTSTGFAFGVPTVAKNSSAAALETKDETDSAKKSDNPLLRSPKAVDIVVPPSLSSNKSSVSSTEASKTTTPNLFTFGAVAQQKPALAVATVAVATSTTVSSTSSSAASNMFTFGAPKPINAATAEPHKTNAAAPVFSFGGSNSNPAASATGAPAASAAAPTSKPFVFGSAATAAENKNSSSIVSSTNSLTTASMSFGAPTTALNSFSAIGNGGKADSSKLFTFGSAAATAVGASSVAASFGSPNQMAAQNAAPAFGAAPTNGGFNMNPTAAQSNSVPKATFSFGNNSQPAANNVFSFGSAEQNSQPTPGGGFSFGGSAAAAPPSNMFNANAKPNINFTMGANPTAFTAPPAQSSDGAPQRRFRKAIRRTPR